MAEDATRLDFPTMQQVEKADKIQLAKWYGGEGGIRTIECRALHRLA